MKLFLLMAMSWAEENGAQHMGEAHGILIPWWNIFVQALNFSILFGILFLLLRKSVKAHFTERAQTYRELVDRAENARKEAEQNHAQMKERLAKLDASAEQGVSRARNEAAQLRTRMIEEAKSLSLKFEQDARRAAAVELEKAKLELRKDLLEKALAASSENLKKSLGSSDQKKLQNEFVEKIEVVGK